MKPPTPTAPRRLTRSRTDRMLGGVAGGIAETYSFDPNLVRLGIVLVTLVTFGTGLIAYGVAWLIVPEADTDEPVLTSAVRNARRRPYDSRVWIGVALVLVGVATLADRFRFGIFNRALWPLLLIGGGAALLLLRDRDQPGRSEPEPPLPDRPVEAPAVPHAPFASPTVTAPVAPVGTATDVTEAPEAPEAPAPTELPDSPDSPASSDPTLVDPVMPATGEPPPPSAYPPSLPWPEPPRPRLPRPPRRRERSMLGRLTWSALLIVAGTAWLVDLVDAADVDARFVLAVELGVVGIALLVGAWYGRSRGLIAVGIVLAFFAGSFAALDVPLRGDIGERIVRPASIGDLDGSYHIAIGHLVLDLRETVLDGKPHKVELTDAMGFIEVFVPENARVQVKAHSDVGSLDIMNRRELSGTDESIVVIDDPPGAPGARILIDAHVGFGAVRVTRDEAPVDLAARAALEVSR